MRFEKYKKGFGLLEVAISGAIITIILSSLVVLGRSSLTSSEVAAERSEATYMAQAALETVRQIRDTNWIDADPATSWDTLCFDVVASVRKHRCEALPDKTYQAYFETTEHRYFLKSAPTPRVTDRHDNIAYTTEIKLLLPSSAPDPILPTNDDSNDVSRDDNALVVQATVSWVGQVPGDKRTVTVRELLTNWRPNY